MATYSTLESIVRATIDQEGYDTPHKFMRYLNIANRGLKELTFDVLESVKPVVLDVDNTMRVDLPTDFVDYTFLGVILPNGTLEPLGKGSNIPGTGQYNMQIPRTVLTEDQILLREFEPQFGMGGGQNRNGYYLSSIDLDNWQMILSGVLVGSFIYMEYISDGRTPDGNTIVHPYAEAALIAYIYWKSIEMVRTVDPNEKLMARKAYYNEKRLARARFASFTKEEALQQIRKGFKQSPKL